MLEKIHDFPNQLEISWKTNWIKKLPIDTKKINHVIIAGMGGSGIAGKLGRELFLGSKTPIDAWSDYGCPGWVDENTLFIAVSYSGETEETLDATKAAIEKKAQIVAITKGGKLEELSLTAKFPIVKIEYDSSPREALGWLYGSLLTVLVKSKAVDLTEERYFKAHKELKNAVETRSFPEKAQQLAMSMANKVPVIISVSPLTAVANRWVTQINENAKEFALQATLPEMCHNTIVGLEYTIPEKLQFLYLESTSAFSRNILRGKIIHQIIEKREIPVIPMTMRNESPLAEQWLFIYFGDLLSYYLAGVNGADPSPIESINFLKEELKKA